MFVPEIAVLGNSLDEINQLGPEAQHKLATLPTLPDESVTATIYELLVGAASIRHGLSLTMIPEDRAAKVPDFRINSFETIPAVIECKRRLGLTNYELDEARQIETFYFPIRQYLHDHAIHGVIEASFAVEIQTVAREAFATDVINMVRTDRDSDTTPTSWGTLAFRRLAYYDTFRPTRLYSPNYLQRAFHWEPLQEAWDGLLCEVEPPSTVSVDSFRAPRCIKWRSESDTALTKKSRGILSLWTSALKQIPPGEIGFIYIGYPEGSRPRIADARTQHIISSMEEAWHRWFVRVPVTVINRLYPRMLGDGDPDLIESVIPGVAKGQEHWLSKVTWNVFTQQFENHEWAD